jgi:endonuclease YncB( thermonuclease family)
MQIILLQQQPPESFASIARRTLCLLILFICLSLATACVPTNTATQDSDAPELQESQDTPESLQVKVIRILDGDTIEVLDLNNNTTRIRLQGIDAPEKTQAFGNRARQRLSDLVFNKNVTIQISDHDVYGRAIAKVLIDNNDICLQLISEGFAWHFKRYAQNQIPNDRLTYSAAEETSRERKIGLWADSDPIPPWQYRKQN